VPSLRTPTHHCRMAPEYKWPYSPNDCYDVLEKLSALIPGGDTSKVILAGDSAGGNLTAVVAMMVRDMPVQNVKIIHQLLIYPCMFNRGTVSRTDPYMANAPALPEWCMSYFEKLYTPKNMTAEEMSKEPYVSPGSASNLKDLPDATGIVAGMDILRDEGVAYFKELEKNKNSIKWKQWDELTHGFVMVDWKKHPDMVNFVVSRLREAIHLSSEKLQGRL
jgi:acetyl esterase